MSTIGDRKYHFRLDLTAAAILFCCLTVFTAEFKQNMKALPSCFSDTLFTFSKWGRTDCELACRIGYCYQVNKNLSLQLQLINDNDSEQECDLYISQIKLRISPYDQFVRFQDSDLNWYYDSAKYRTAGDRPDAIKVKPGDTLKAFTIIDYQLFHKDTLYTFSVSTEGQKRTVKKRAGNERTRGENNSKSFMFNDSEVIGYLDNPAPVFIIDKVPEYCRIGSDSITCRVEGKPASSYESDDLIGLLKGGSFQQRYASEELVYRSNSVIKELIQSISTDTVMNERIFTILKRIKGQAVVNAVSDNFFKWNQNARVHVGNVLIELSDTLHPKIYKELLLSDDYHLVSEVIRRFEKYHYAEILPVLEDFVGKTEYWYHYTLGSRAILKLTGKYPDSSEISKIEEFITHCDTTPVMELELLQERKLETIWPFLFEKFNNFTCYPKAFSDVCHTVRLFNLLKILDYYENDIDPYIIRMLGSRPHYDHVKYDAVLLLFALKKQNDFRHYDIERELESARKEYEYWVSILDDFITRE